MEATTANIATMLMTHAANAIHFDHIHSAKRHAIRESTPTKHNNCVNDSHSERSAKRQAHMEANTVDSTNM